jgi:hypothetical protein
MSYFSLNRKMLRKSPNVNSPEADVTSAPKSLLSLEHHLVTGLAAGQLKQVDDLHLGRRRRRNLGRPQRHLVGRDPAGQDDGIAVGADADLFAREQGLETLLERRHARIDDDIVLPAFAGAPDDEADCA